MHACVFDPTISQCLAKVSCKPIPTERKYRILMVGNFDSYFHSHDNGKYHTRSDGRLLYISVLIRVFTLNVVAVWPILEKPQLVGAR